MYIMNNKKHQWYCIFIINIAFSFDYGPQNASIVHSPWEYGGEDWSESVDANGTDYGPEQIGGNLDCPR